MEKLAQFEIQKEMAHAFGRASSGGFLVLSGSTAMRDGSPHVKRNRAQTERLLEQGVLVPDSNPALYRFSRDHLFSSKSAAAGVVIDGNSNGSHWKPLHAKTLALDPAAIDRWVSVLKAEFEGFEHFDPPHAGFDARETNYKLEFAERLKGALEESQSPAEYAEAYERAKTKEDNLIDWQPLDNLQKNPAKEQIGAVVARFHAAHSVTSPSDTELTEFVGDMVGAWREGSEKSGDPARLLGEAIAMLLFPAKAILFKHTPLANCYLEAVGRRFDWYASAAEQYTEELRFARAVKKAFDERGLAPRNLMDVQSALWVVHNHKSEPQDAPAITKETPTMTGPLNTILYGPPGTGKTYETAARAVLICDGALPDDPDPVEARKLVMQRYKALEKAHRIAFVTFHQSYGYEEFVEGLRPETGEDAGQGAGFRLETKDGVLKTMASRARNAQASVADSFDPEGRQVFKMSLGRYDASDEDYLRDECFEKGYVLLGYGGQVDWSAPQYSDWQEIATRWREQPGCEEASGSDPNIVQIWQLRARMKVGDVIVVSHGNLKARAIGVVTGDYEYAPREMDSYHHRRAVKWHWIGESNGGIDVQDLYESRFSQQTIYVLNRNKIHWSGLLPHLETRSETGETLPHVLIIDEINRANISKVMGELITLLEEDKREGQPNALSVVLPHSKKPFTLPSNLHILGTMNTADRSIALLDTALRRRFRFEGIDPKPGVLKPVDGVDLPRVLEMINARLEYLIGPDHLIGHAWMMGADTVTDLDRIMATKVIPLMREYFHEDLGRVRAVLGGGDAFLAQTELPVPPGLDSMYHEPRYRYVDRYDGAGAYGRAAYDELLGDDDGSGEQGGDAG